LKALNSQTNVVNASAATGAITLVSGDRAASAMTITTGTANDTVAMRNAGDVLNGGLGTDTLNVNANFILGGIQVDLSSTTDQVTTFNGSANTAVQVGFENVDLSGVTGTFGADITARAAGSRITGTANADIITGGAGADTIVASAGNDVVTGGGGDDTFIFTAALIEANSANNQATYDGGTGANSLQVTGATTGLVDADLRGITLIQTLTLANDTNSIALGTNAISAGIKTVNGGVTSADTITMTKAFAEQVGLTLNLGTTGTDTIVISDSGAVSFANATIASADALTVAADAGADAIVIKQAFFDSGAGTTAATLTITGAVDADNDTLTILAGTTAWDAAAEANAADVDIAGEYHISNAGVADGVLTYFNEAGNTVVTLTLVGLNDGAVAIVAGNLVFTG
jgi:hypothetical protein